MERLRNRFMLVYQEQGNTTLTNRTLFDGIQILMGDSDHVVAKSKSCAPQNISVIIFKEIE